MGFGSTRNASGTDAGEESAKLAALYSLVKGKQKNTYNLSTSNCIRKSLPLPFNIAFTNYEKGQMNKLKIPRLHLDKSIQYMLLGSDNHIQNVTPV